jgi:mannose-6-phosphate isomerase-like protein (cupin superfamily)
MDGGMNCSTTATPTTTEQHAVRPEDAGDDHSGRLRSATDRVITARAPPSGSPATSTSTPSPPRRPVYRRTSCTSCPAPAPAWHRHPLGQSLFVTEGIGLCQRRGGTVEVIRAGDRVYIEPDGEHWHGASPNRLMVHLALNKVDDDHPAHWGEHVSDDEDNSATTDTRHE